MSKQGKREYINMIKRKLTLLNDINEDIINQILEDAKDLLNIEIEPETTNK